LFDKIARCYAFEKFERALVALLLLADYRCTYNEGGDKVLQVAQEGLSSEKAEG